MPRPAKTVKIKWSAAQTVQLNSFQSFPCQDLVSFQMQQIPRLQVCSCRSSVLTLLLFLNLSLAPHSLTPNLVPWALWVLNDPNFKTFGNLIHECQTSDSKSPTSSASTWIVINLSFIMDHPVKGYLLNAIFDTDCHYTSRLVLRLASRSKA
jgi:hypothetical protein